MTGSDLGTDRKRGLQGKQRVGPGREGASSSRGREGRCNSGVAALGRLRVAAVGLFGKQ